ncbi:DUF222 domain-containing protein [Geodermatophilus sp. URMC 64]
MNASAPPAEPDAAASGSVSPEWPVFGPPVALAEGPLGVVQAADREIARLTAVRARAVAGFAAGRPASADRAQGEPGAMSAARWAARPEVLRPVSEWATAELQVALACTEGAAARLLEQSLTLAQRLPGVLAALESGGLHAGHLWPWLDLVAPIAADRVRAEVQAELLGWVAARAAAGVITTPPQLRDRARRVVARRDARAAADRAARALRERGVFRQTVRKDDLAALGVYGSEPEIAALSAALGAYADAVDDEPGAEPRSRPRKMLDCLLDLVLRPGEGGRPPVQVTLTLVAAVQTLLGGDAPGELNGQVVSADTARQLLRALTGAELGEEALAGYLAATDGADPADRESADTDGAEAESADTDTAEAASAGDEWLLDPCPDMSGWTTRMRAAHAAWEAEWERRLAAGEFDDPDPLTEAEIIAAAERAIADGEIDLELQRALIEADERWWADFEAGRITDPDLPVARPADPPPADPPPTAGWWAAADRAVEDASQARYRAQLALGHARRMVDTAERADAADERARRASTAARVDAARDALTALAAAAGADRAALAELLARGGGGGLADRPRLALVDVLSGALVSLTDLPGLRRAAHCGADACRRAPHTCGHGLTGRPGLGAPGPTAGYRPSAALDRFVRARDRRCRFPGCRRPVATGELDHRIRYPDGPTAASNLAGFCVGNHRGKHQAPGWRYEGTSDGTLTVTTPTGLTAVTTPPPY